jgi:hypothetical protein
MQPPMPMPGMGDPGGYGGLDPGLMQPLAGGQGLLGGGQGLLGGGAQGRPGPGMGGGTLFGSPMPGLLDGVGLAQGGGLLGPSPFATAALTEPTTGDGVAPEATDSIGTASDAAALTVPEPPGHRALHARLVRSHIRLDPAAMRLQTQPTADGVDVTLALPMAGTVAIDALGGRDLTVAGVASTRLRLTKLGTNLWKPAGIGVLAGVSADAPPFRLTRLTIKAAGHKAWVIEDPQAIMPFDRLPNLPVGTRVTVTASVTGETTGALPFLVVNGKLLHMLPAPFDVAGDASYTRTFTLTPLAVKIGKAAITRDAGMIGVKVVEMPSLQSEGHAKVQAAGWTVVFPSHDGGQPTGFAQLPESGRLSRHVQAILGLLDLYENRPGELFADGTPKAGK